MAMFGLVNGGYSSLIAWLAPYYQELGWSGATSGTLISVMALSQGCGAVALPLLAQNRLDWRPWLWSTVALQAFGFAGLAFTPSALPVVWAAGCGFGLSGSFALSLLVALDHLSDARQAGLLAALMQGGGFLITAVPPFLLASQHDATGSFASDWIMHLAWIAAAGFVRLLTRDHTYG